MRLLLLPNGISYTARLSSYMSPKFQRRSHNKSRKGCSQCKFRKIKCDERSPECSNCERRQISCDFSTSEDLADDVESSAPLHEETGPSRHRNPTRPNMQETSNGSISNTAPAFISLELGVSNLELMHHYSTVTGPELGNMKKGRDHIDIWQKHMTHLAFSHEFLLRGILTISALHLSHLVPKRRLELVMKASSHQQIALKTFQETLPTLNEHNCVALFAYSCLLIPIAFATSKESGNESDADPFQWVWMLHGGYSILQMHTEFIVDSFLKPLLESMSPVEIETPKVRPI